VKRYKFYFSKGSTKEAIGVITSNSLKEATSYFSKVKAMKEEDFTNIFTVEADDRS